MLDLGPLSVIAMLAGPPAPAMPSYYSARYMAYSNVSDSAFPGKASNQTSSGHVGIAHDKHAYMVAHRISSTSPTPTTLHYDCLTLTRQEIQAAANGSTVCANTSMAIASHSPTLQQCDNWAAGLFSPLAFGNLSDAQFCAHSGHACDMYRSSTLAGTTTFDGRAAQVWEFSYNHTISPQQTATIDYKFTIDAAAQLLLAWQTHSVTTVVVNASTPPRYITADMGSLFLGLEAPAPAASVQLPPGTPPCVWVPPPPPPPAGAPALAEGAELGYMYGLNPAMMLDLPPAPAALTNDLPEAADGSKPLPAQAYTFEADAVAYVNTSRTPFLGAARYHLALDADQGLLALTMHPSSGGSVRNVFCLDHGTSALEIRTDSSGTATCAKVPMLNSTAAGCAASSSPRGGCFGCVRRLPVLPESSGIVPGLDPNATFVGTQQWRGLDVDAYHVHRVIHAGGMRVEFSIVWLFLAGTGELRSYEERQTQTGSQPGFHNESHVFTAYSTTPRPSQFTPPAGVTCS